MITSRMPVGFSYAFSSIIDVPGGIVNLPSATVGSLGEKKKIKALPAIVFHQIV